MKLVDLDGLIDVFDVFCFCSNVHGENSEFEAWKRLCHKQFSLLALMNAKLKLQIFCKTLDFLIMLAVDSNIRHSNSWSAEMY